MEKQNYDDEGIFRVAAAMFQQTKSDYIIGKIVMIRKLRRVVDFKEWNSIYRHKLGKESAKRIDLYFDAKNFIEKDPYGAVEGVSDPKTIFKNWDREVAEAVSYGTPVSKSSIASATRIKNM